MTAAEADLVRELLELNRARPEMTLAQRRELYERADAAFADLDGDGDAADPAAQLVAVGQATALWAHRAADSRPTVLYLHGGSYTMGSPRSHRHLAKEVGIQAAASVLVLDYRRPPEHPFPAAVDDAMAAYHHLREQGVPAERIALAGDSAGSGLALALLQRLRELAEPLPAAAACLSPWTDLSCGFSSHDTLAERDPVLRTDDLRAMGRLYLGGADPHTPLASPAFADLAGLPPLLVQVGTEEILLDDAVVLADRARAAGVPVEFELWPGMFHVWHYYFPLLSEGREAIASIGRFIAAHAGGGAAVAVTAPSTSIPSPRSAGRRDHAGP
ncbi:MAG TPA: alpha/beta hydrolase [Actinocrinis sp.]|nr:alpha/beta hydrolase [Actinocrinis sp.]